MDQAQIKIQEQKQYEPELTVKDGVAVIPVSGSITKRAGFLSFLFGGASIDRIRADLDAAMDDRRVKAAVLYVDSPGGRVNGVSELAEYVNGLREKKPIVTFSDGQITSAATWIGSASDKKIISPTAADGSIGVLTVHVDMSKMDEKAGIKVTYLTAGKYKAIGNDAEPLSDQARKMIEERLNQTYDVFIDAMARFRNADKDKVRSEMAEGRVFIGQQAIDVGLSDRLGSLDDAIETAAELAGKTSAGGFVYKQATYGKKENTMEIKDITTKEQLQEAFPQLAKQIADSAAETARAGVDVETPKKEAVSAETERILGLAKIHFGQDAGDKFASVVKGGVTVEQYQAMADALGNGQNAGDGQGGQGGDSEFRSQMLNGINNAGAQDVGAGGGDGKGPQSWDQAVAAIQAEEKCTKAEAMKKAYKQYPDLHKKFVQEANKNNQ